MNLLRCVGEDIDECIEFIGITRRGDVDLDAQGHESRLEFLGVGDRSLLIRTGRIDYGPNGVPSENGPTTAIASMP